MSRAVLLRGGAWPGRPDVAWLAWLSPPLFVLGIVLVYPLALMGAQAFHDPSGAPGLGHFATVLRSTVFRHALQHTLEIALTSTLLCLVLGFALALLLSFVPFRGSRAIGRLIDAYLAYPSFLIALSLIFLYGNAGVFSVFGHALFGAGPNATSFLYVYNLRLHLTDGVGGLLRWRCLF